MLFRLINKSLMSLCPFTKILAPPITPFFDGLEKFRRVVSSFRKASPQGDPFPPPMLMLQANVQKAKGLIDEYYLLSCYELESITGIPETTVRGILVSHLGLRNVYSV